jgi:hypothetical protein
MRLKEGGHRRDASGVLELTNCQVGVFLAYAGPKGRALTGR